MFRQLPPVATPLPVRTWLAAPLAGSGAQQQFQSQFARWLPAPACFVASSGRTALFLTLAALAADRPARREVIMPAYTCPSLAKVTLEAGLRPSLVDIDPRTLAMDRAGLLAALGERTLAVIWVQPFGIPQPLDGALEQAHGQGAALIEDAAQSMGAAYDGRRVGAHGDYGLFSLGPGKPISAGGGGIASANTEAGAALLAAAWQKLPEPSPVASWLAWLRLTAFSAAFQPAGWWLASRLGAQNVGDQEASWGFRLTGLTASQAAVAQAQLARLDAINGQRRRQAAALAERVRAFDCVTPIQASEAAHGSEPIYLRYPLLAAGEATRDRLLQRLQAAGIGAGAMYRRTLAEFFPTLDDAPYPGARQVARGLFTLPTHHHLRPADLDRITAVLAQESADLH